MNEITEEYARGEEEATLELQTVATQEERAKTRTETEQPQEESRKRKRNAEEAKVEQGEDVEVDDFVSNKA